MDDGDYTQNNTEGNDFDGKSEVGTERSGGLSTKSRNVEGSQFGTEAGEDSDQDVPENEEGQDDSEDEEGQDIPEAEEDEDNGLGALLTDKGVAPLNIEVTDGAKMDFINSWAQADDQGPASDKTPITNENVGGPQPKKSCLRTLGSSSKAPASVSTTPAVADKAPAPVDKGPAPVSKAPAPASKAPAPVSKAPAPVSKAPAPASKAPAPASKLSAPVVQIPQVLKDQMTPDQYIYALIKECKTQADVLAVCRANDITIKPMPVQRVFLAPIVHPTEVAKTNKKRKPDSDENRDNEEGDETESKMLKYVGENLFGVRIFAAGEKPTDHAYIAYQAKETTQYKGLNLRLTGEKNPADGVSVLVHADQFAEIKKSLTLLDNKRLGLVSKYLQESELRRLIMDPSHTMLRDRFVILMCRSAELFSAILSYLEAEKEYRSKLAREQSKSDGKRKNVVKFPHLSQAAKDAGSWYRNEASQAVKDDIRKIFEDPDSKVMIRKAKHIVKIGPASIFPEDMKIIEQCLGFDPTEFPKNVERLDKKEHGLIRIVLECMQELGYIQNGFYVYEKTRFPADFFIDSRTISMCKDSFKTTQDNIEYATRMKGMVTTLGCMADVVMTKTVSHIKVFLHNMMSEMGEFVQANYDGIKSMVRDKLYSDKVLKRALSSVVDSSMPLAYNTYTQSRNHFKNTPNALYKRAPGYLDYKDMEYLRYSEIFPKFDMRDDTKDRAQIHKRRLENLAKGREVQRQKRSDGQAAPKRKNRAPVDQAMREARKTEKKQEKAEVSKSMRDGSITKFNLIWKEMMAKKPTKPADGWNEATKAVHEIFLLFQHYTFTKSTLFIDKNITLLDGAQIPSEHIFTMSPSSLKVTFNNLRKLGVDGNMALKMMKAVIQDVREAHGDFRTPNLNFDVIIIHNEASREKIPRLSKIDAVKTAFHIPDLSLEQYSRIAPVFLFFQCRVRTRYNNTVEKLSGAFSKALSAKNLARASEEEKLYSDAFYARNKGYRQKIEFFTKLSDEILESKLVEEKAVSIFKKSSEFDSWDESQDDSNDNDADYEEELKLVAVQYCMDIVRSVKQFLVPHTYVDDHRLTIFQFCLINKESFDIQKVTEKVEKIVASNNSLSAGETPNPLVTVEAYMQDLEKRFNEWVASVTGKDQDGNPVPPVLLAKEYIS